MNSLIYGYAKSKTWYLVSTVPIKAGNLLKNRFLYFIVIICFRVSAGSSFTIRGSLFGYSIDITNVFQFSVFSTIRFNNLHVSTTDVPSLPSVRPCGALIERNINADKFTAKMVLPKANDRRFLFPACNGLMTRQIDKGLSVSSHSWQCFPQTMILRA